MIVSVAAVKCCFDKALLRLPLLSTLWEAAAFAAGPVPGKSSALQQLSRRRWEGERRRVPHRGGATMSQAPSGQKCNC